MNDNIKPSSQLVVLEVDVCAQFINKQVFIVHKHMIQWVCMETWKLRFGVVIGKYDNDSDKR